MPVVRYQHQLIRQDAFVLKKDVLYIPYEKISGNIDMFAVLNKKDYNLIAIHTGKSKTVLHLLVDGSDVDFGGEEHEKLSL